MARRRIREYSAKKLLNRNSKCVQVTPETDLDDLAKKNPWLREAKLVVKPDMLFGKRGKNNLVLLDASFDDAKRFIMERMGSEIEINNVHGVLTHFIVEPFMPHEKEYYLSIVTARAHDLIRFSTAGGMSVEENWDKMKEFRIPVGTRPHREELKTILGVDDRTAEFISSTYQTFHDLDFSLIEFNPFTFDSDGNPFPLDCRGELDDTAEFKNYREWGALEFPKPFGKKLSPEEQFIEDMDHKSGSSLKLTILNPHGKIWTMVAGGGASVIYTDTIVDLGMAQEIANYGEYSGDPNTEETYQYAKTILDLATRDNDGKRRVLIIGGGVANFTDVANTFKGIIQALREYKDKIKTSKMRIFVRRGGPNYEAGLKMMKELGEELKIPIDVYGPDAHMTKIVPMAIDYVKGA
ncbi:ATPase [Candidatus Micrarchaeota archaeon]|nr:ATPase [Candidatus Micrarchaeota archaeon]